MHKIPHTFKTRTLIRVYLCYRSVDGFIKSNKHVVEMGLDFTSHSKYPYPAHTEPNLHIQPVNKAVITTTSSDKILVNSTSTLPNISCFDVPQQLSTDFTGCAVFNNYLFHQDPGTGRLSLVPVQVRVPESLLGLDINLSLVPQPFQGIIPVPEKSDGPYMDCLNVPVRPKPQDCVPPLSSFNGSSSVSDSPLEDSAPRAYIGQTNPATQSNDQSPSEPISPKVHPALKEVIDLLRGEFSLDGYLENGHEDIAMGMYF